MFLGVFLILGYIPLLIMYFLTQNEESLRSVVNMTASILSLILFVQGITVVRKMPLKFLHILYTVGIIFTLILVFTMFFSAQVGPGIIGVFATFILFSAITFGIKSDIQARKKK